MIKKKLKICLVLLLSALFFNDGNGQSSVAAGINYQAVARDNSGKELVNKVIDVKFSIISDNPLGEIVYQEVHSNKATSKYGVFSLVIGKGTYTSGIFRTLEEINWGQADHYLKVEIKFDNDFLDMGTMQFMAVPYALYAWKSLEPGPEGPKGDPGPKGEPGDPASDNQNLSFDESILSITNGNSVPLTSLLQNLTISNTPEGNYLGISRGNSVLLSTVESDGDPLNEIQDLNYDAVNRKLTLLKSNAPAIDLTELKNDADADPVNEIQTLNFTAADNRLQILNGNTVDLTSLKNDADANPLNEIQDLNLTSNVLTITNKTSPTAINLAPYLDNTDNQALSFNQSTNTISLTNGGSVNLGSMVAFRAEKLISETKSQALTEYDFIFGTEDYDDGSGYNPVTGIFRVPSTGIYSFVLNYIATGTGEYRILLLFVNNVLYEVLNNQISSNSNFSRQTTLKLSAGDEVKIKINVGTGLETGIGSFSGYKVY